MAAIHIHRCVGIKATGEGCNKRPSVGQTRCGTHLRSVFLHGPNATAVTELRYTHKRLLKELDERWAEMIDAEPNDILRQDMIRDFRHQLQLQKIQQQHAIELLERTQRDEVLRTGVDPDAEANARRAHAILIRHEQQEEFLAIRAQARLDEMNAEQQIRLRIAGVVQRAIAPVGELGRFAADNQNVHTTQSVVLTKEMVSRLLKIPVPDGYRWNTSECSKTPGEIIMTCKLSMKAAWQMTAKYCQDEDIYELGKGIYGKVLDSVWQYILNSSDKEDLFRCVKQEMEDNIGMCAQGNLSRLCNILAGYMEGIGSQESVSEILGRTLPKLMEIDDLSERLARALEILKANNVPIVDWKQWIEPLTSDQDNEMDIRYLRNAQDDIIGLVAGLL
jgi:hypothetical protein